MVSIRRVLAQIKDDGTAVLSEEHLTRICRQVGATWRHRTLTPVVTIYVFLLQVLHGNTALTNLPGYYVQYPNCNHLNGDMNGDGVVNNFDVDLFTQYLVGHAGATGLRLKFGWDAENRLTLVEPLVPQNGDKKVTFSYDYLGRRVEKKVFVRTGGQWPANANEVRRFLWAGWVMLMELDGLNQNAVVRKYTWGLDLAAQAGSVGILPSALEAAGGIGGLLAVQDANGTPNDPNDDLKYVYLYDGNGNVGQVIDWSAADAGSSIKAHYEYDPYGNVTRQTGPYADGTEPDNHVTFSTKYFDAETGLGYWGYRYYSPRMGRWISRDPEGEVGAENLLSYVQNGPADGVDALGRVRYCRKDYLSLHAFKCKRFCNSGGLGMTFCHPCAFDCMCICEENIRKLYPHAGAIVTQCIIAHETSHFNAGCQNDECEPLFPEAACLLEQLRLLQGGSFNVCGCRCLGDLGRHAADLLAKCDEECDGSSEEDCKVDACDALLRVGALTAQKGACQIPEDVRQAWEECRRFERSNLGRYSACAQMGGSRLCAGQLVPR